MPFYFILFFDFEFVLFVCLFCFVLFCLVLFSFDFIFVLSYPFLSSRFLSFPFLFLEKASLVFPFGGKHGLSKKKLLFSFCDLFFSFHSQGIATAKIPRV